MNFAVIIHDSRIILDTIMRKIELSYPNALKFVLQYTHPQEFLEDLEQGLEVRVALVDASLASDRTIDGYDVMNQIVEKRPGAKVYCISSYKVRPSKASFLPKKVVHLEGHDFEMKAEVVGESCTNSS